MIVEPPVLKVRRQFPRPDTKAIEPLRDTSTCFIVDCMDGRGAMDYRIRPIDEKCCHFVGVAITCHTGPSDNLAIKGAIEFSQPGDIIIAAADAFVGTATAGDLMVGVMRNRRIGALVTDGLVRDVDDIRPIGVPVFCRGVSPNSGVSNGPGTVGLPITIGGVTVEAGDVVVGDINGVVVIPQLRLNQVGQRLAEVRASEAEFDRRVRDGLDHVEAVQELIDADRVQFLD